MEYDLAGADGISVIGVDGSGLTEVANGQDHAWSPDGSRIVFWVSGQFWAVNADGTNATLVFFGNFSRIPVTGLAPRDEDGDGVLAQYGIYDFGAPKRFQVDLTTPVR